MAWLQQPGRTKEAVASLAPTVSELAQGDAAAAHICADAGEELARLATSARRRLRFDTEPAVGLTGNVLLNSRPVRQAAEKVLREECPALRVELSALASETGTSLLLADRMQRGTPADLAGRRPNTGRRWASLTPGRQYPSSI